MLFKYHMTHFSNIDLLSPDTFPHYFTTRLILYFVHSLLTLECDTVFEQAMLKRLPFFLFYEDIKD